jgi:DNA-binding IscR family transcriptional regulator
VRSAKGPNGGFFLQAADLKHSLAEVVIALEGEGLYHECVLGLKLCNDKKPCPAHHQYQEIRKQIIQLIEGNTIADFNAKLDSGKYFLSN